ncbi:MAG: Rieske 2Fe-2S domain-containing protein [Gammaproteobacteria bacterium]|nr:Rieske 2Fe-2S domain-containing protein [Gammaproteobacteria bacterium]
MQTALQNTADIADGEMRAFRIGETDVLVCRVDGQLFAVENVCSHHETRLCDGALHGHLVECPLHFAQFDVRDGSHRGPPAFTGIRTFPISAGGIVTIEPAETIFDPGAVPQSR